MRNTPDHQCGDGYHKRRTVWSPPPPGIAVTTYAKDHHSTSHRQGMEAPYILVDEHEAHTHGEQRTQIVNSFTCVVGGALELWNWCCTDFRPIGPHMWFIINY